MPYIDTKHLFKCETCRRFRGGKCLAWCESMECYSPNMKNIPTVDVVPRNEYDAVVSALDNSTKEFLKLHDAYQKQKSEHEEAIEVIKETHRLAGEVKADIPLLVKHTKEETAREIFELVECAFSPALVYEGHTVKAYIAELEKKYIGEEKEDKRWNAKNILN